MEKVNLKNLSQAISWYHNLKTDPTKMDQFKSDCTQRIRNEVNKLPSGSGLDTGVKLDLDRSSAEKLVFDTEFHHLNENGYYDGWTQHTVTVTPSFDGFNLKISGRDRNGIKDYLYDLFSECFE